MRMPSGSSLERAITCTGSVTLPAVQNINEAASSGTTIHDFHYWARKESIEAAWKKAGVVSDEMKKKLDQLVLQLPKIPLPPGYAGESAFAYDIEKDSARYLGENIARQYGDIGPTEVALSLDITGQENGEGWVYDIKTGFLAVTPPANNWQLRVGALAMARAHGLGKVTVGITKTSGLYPWTETATFDAMDLDGFAADLQKALVKWRGEPRFTTGPQCQYCPAISACPAQTGLIKSALLNSPAANLNKEDWVGAYEQLKALKAAVKHLEDAVRVKAQQEPILLRSGLSYGISPSGTVKEFKK